MRFNLWLIVAVFSFVVPLWAEIEVYFSPDGGFSPVNKYRFIQMPDGRKLPPTLNNAVLEMIENTKRGGVIKIAMYALSEKGMEDVLIKTAFEKGIKVKLLLDGVAEWTGTLRKEFIAKLKEARDKSPKSMHRLFQLKIIYKQAFIDRGRKRKLSTGETIYGTMHEKFGIFYQPGCKIPFDCFGGSSNISYGSDHVFAENRFTFKNEPDVARQYAKEFARLWNEYGSDEFGNAESEPYIPAEAMPGGVRVIFNSEPKDEEHYYAIDGEFLEMLKQVNFKNGTIDIFMFSWTHFQLAQYLLEIAQRFPNVKVRILMDQTQLVNDEAHRGIIAPYLEDKIKEFKLENVSIKYKWRSNLFFFEDLVIPTEEGEANKNTETTIKVDPQLEGVPTVKPTDDVDNSDDEENKDEDEQEEKEEQKVEPPKVEPPKVEPPKVEPPKAEPPKDPNKPVAIHWRNYILHHKVLIVNRTLMLAGSYNWSTSAERRNFESVMAFNGKYPGHQAIVDRMQAEFDYLWRCDYEKSATLSEKISRPQVISAAIGRDLTKKIVELLSKPGMKQIIGIIDRNREGIAEDTIIAKSKMEAEEVREKLKELHQNGLIYCKTVDEKSIYGLSD